MLMIVYLYGQLFTCKSMKMTLLFVYLTVNIEIEKEKEPKKIG